MMAVLLELQMGIVSVCVRWGGWAFQMWCLGHLQKNGNE